MKTKPTPSPQPKAFRPSTKRIIHDLNNEIFVVTSNADFLMSALPVGSPDHADAVEILDAGFRAAADVVRLQAVVDDLVTAAQPA